METYNFENSWICSPKFLHTEPINLAFKESVSNKAQKHSAKYYNQHTYFRKNVNIENIEQAVLKITADDYYKLYINGTFVTQGPANSYAHCYNFNTLDISKYLRVGQNTFAVHVHYQGYINRAYNSGDLRQGMIADLFIKGKNVFDSEWKCYDTSMHKGRDKVAYHTQFNEKIDNRKSLAWFSDDFDDSAWKTAPIKQVDYTFVPQITPNLAVYKAEPHTVTAIKGGYFIDFGSTITGTIAFKAHGKRGNRVKVRCGEELNSDGSVRYKMRCSTIYDDVFILKTGENILEQYEYKCFRYMEVTAKSSVKLSDFAVIARHYPYKNTLNLQTANPLLAKTWEICANAVKYCAQEVYVDCPHREKGQYLGDLTVTGHSQMWLTGDTRLFKKAMDDFKQSAFICKGLTAVAPASFVQEIADFSLLYPYQQLLLYNFSGDREFLQNCLPTIEALAEYFTQFIGENGLLWSVKDKWNLVDWPMNLRDNYDFPLKTVIDDGCHNVINALYVGMIKCIEQIKDILGVEYDSNFDRLKQAYIDTFFDAETGLFVDAIGSKHSSLHSNTYAIFFDLAPNKHNIVSHIKKKGLSCGVFMSYFVLMGLINIGETELAIELLTNTTSHSWHNMISEGATTAFEAWGKDQKKNTSLCHSWASAPIMVITEGLIGLKMVGGKLTKTAKQHSLASTIAIEMNYNGKQYIFTPQDSNI